MGESWLCPNPKLWGNVDPAADNLKGVKVEAKINFGITIQLLGKKTVTLTGLYPSPAYPTPHEVLRQIANVINEALLTNFVVMQTENDGEQPAFDQQE